MIRKLLSLTLTLITILTACGAPAPDGYDWCYIYDFAESDYDINIISGVWVDGAGLQTDGTGFLQASWVHDELVTPDLLIVKVTRPSGVTGDVIVTAAAIAFGVEISFTETLPAAFSEVIIPIEPASAGESGTSVNFTLDASAPLNIETFEVRGRFDNPFDVNFCGQFTPSPSPGATNTPTPTPSPTFTPTAGPSPTPNPGYFYYGGNDTREVLLTGNAGGINQTFTQNISLNIDQDDWVVGLYFDVLQSNGGSDVQSISGISYSSAISNATATYCIVAPGNYPNPGTNWTATNLCVDPDDFVPSALLIPNTSPLSAAGYEFLGDTASHLGENRTVTFAFTANDFTTYTFRYSNFRWIYFGIPDTTPTPTGTATRTPLPTATGQTVTPTRTPIVVNTPTPNISQTPSGTPTIITSTPPATRTPIAPPTSIITPTIDPSDPNPNPNTENEAEWEILDSIGEFFTWVQNAVGDLFAWLGQLGNWLIGTAANLIASIGYAIQGILNFIGSILAFLVELFDIGRLLIEIIFGVIKLLFTWIADAIARALAIFQAFFNAPTIPIPGMPLCKSVPLDYQICAIFYVMDWTLFAPNTPGQFIIPLVTTIINLFIILYFVRFVLRLLRKGEQVTHVG